jgi:hypothetical protein
MGKVVGNHDRSIVQGINHTLDLVINKHLVKQIINHGDGLEKAVKAGWDRYSSLEITKTIGSC